MNHDASVLKCSQMKCNQRETTRHGDWESTEFWMRSDAVRDAAAGFLGGVERTMVSVELEHS